MHAKMERASEVEEGCVMHPGRARLVIKSHRHPPNNTSQNQKSLASCRSGGSGGGGKRGQKQLHVHAARRIILFLDPRKCESAEPTIG